MVFIDLGSSLSLAAGRELRLAAQVNRNGNVLVGRFQVPTLDVGSGLIDFKTFGEFFF